jgi:hypothetical protein
MGYLIMSKRYEIKFYVGTGFDTHGVAIQVAPALIELAENKLCEFFGGGTVYQHSGLWQDSVGPVVREPGITLVSVVTSEQVQSVTLVARYLKALFDQNCVLVTRSEVYAEFI